MAFLLIKVSPDVSSPLPSYRVATLQTWSAGCLLRHWYPTGHAKRTHHCTRSRARANRDKRIAPAFVGYSLQVPSLFAPQGHGSALSRGTGKPPTKA